LFFFRNAFDQRVAHRPLGVSRFRQEGEVLDDFFRKFEKVFAASATTVDQRRTFVDLQFEPRQLTLVDERHQAIKISEILKKNSIESEELRNDKGCYFQS
jgi:hypothetical protein